jgi:hypothetical protein
MAIELHLPVPCFSPTSVLLLGNFNDATQSKRLKSHLEQAVSVLETDLGHLQLNDTRRERGELQINAETGHLSPTSIMQLLETHRCGANNLVLETITRRHAWQVHLQRVRGESAWKRPSDA